MGRRLFVVGIGLLASVAQAQSASQRAGSYLLSRQALDGSFGGATGTDPVLTTIEATLALRPLLGATAPEIGSALAFVHAQSPAEVDLAARRLRLLQGTLLADPIAARLLAASLRPQVVLDGAQLGSAFTGNGFLFGDRQASALDTAQTLAFLAAGAEAQPGPIVLGQSANLCGASSAICAVVTPLLETLLALQHADGGWGYADGDSDARLTAEILAVVMPLAGQLQLSGPLSNAATYLLGQQAADGHFGVAQPSTSDTAVAILGLVGAPVATSSAVLKAVAELGASQGSDGSWDESELDTALALRALQASQANLQVAPGTSGLDSSLSLSNAQPQQGSATTATVTVPNAGAMASSPTSVTFVATCPGSAPVTVGTATVPSVAAGGQVTVSGTIDTSELAGDCQITAELGTSSPTGSGGLATTTSLQVVAQDDLAIEPTDVQFRSVNAGLVEISATVHENGAAVAQPFEVGIYQGAPDGGGTLIGSAAVASIGASGSATVTVGWNPATANGPTPIYAVADVQNVVPDANRSNNVAERYYDANPGSTDLAVISSGIIFDPAILHPNTPASVQVVVQNLSAVDAYGTEVELCQISSPLYPACVPGVGQLATLDLVPANGTAIASFPLPGSSITLPPEGQYNQLTFLAAVDPNDLVSDPYRGNNQAIATANVGLYAALTAGLYAQCVLSSGGQVQGTVSLSGLVQVEGGAGPIAVPYALYYGAPEAGGMKIDEGIMLPSDNRFVFEAPPPSSANPLYVLVLDPEDTLHNPTPYLARASATCESYTAKSKVVMSYDDIRVSPVGPAIGETSTVTATVHNEGVVDSTVTLMAFIGDPTTPNGQKLAEWPLSVAAGASATVSFPWTRTGEETNLYFGIFDVDPQQSIDVPNRFFAPSQTQFYTYRNAFLEAVYTSGRSDSFLYSTGAAPQTSPPTIGDLLRTGQPVIGYGEARMVLGDGGEYDQEYEGALTIIQKLPDNSMQTLWSKQIDDAVGQPIFADLGFDAGPQIVFMSTVGPYAESYYSKNSNAFRGNVIHVWNPDGTVAWERSYVLGPDGGPVDACMNEGNLVAPGVGDVNGDGVADVIFPTADGVVHVLDGRTGNPVWEAGLPSGIGCRTYVRTPSGWQPSVLDLFGDGKREVVVGVASHQFSYYGGEGNVEVFSSTGVDLTADGGLFGSLAGFDTFGGNVVAYGLSGPGASPSLTSTSVAGWATAVAPSGQQRWFYAGNSHQVFTGPFAVADGTASGTPLLFLGALGGPFALNGDGTPLWFGDPTGSDGYPSSPSPIITRAVAAADLLGLGSPQYLGVANENALFVLDGRTGADLLKTHVRLADPDNGDDEGEFSDLAIADVDGDGHGEVVVNVQPDGSDYGLSPGYESHASLYIFGSDAHWQAMPNVWSGNQYHHQFNPDLTLTKDAYAPWTTHNSWREQFLNQPVTLRPDLVVGRPDGGSDIQVTPTGPLTGATASVAVTVHNEGGAAASDVPVDLYVGDPDGGGTLVGSSVIPGPLGVRGGSGVATFAWDAWPEGVDQLYTVVNPALPDGGHPIAESRYDNDETWTSVYVGVGTALADLEIASADIAFSPTFAVGGQPVSVSVTVHNLGVATAGPFEVAISDGAGGDGPAIGTLPIAGLAPGARATVTATGWLPVEGPHLVTAIADPSHLVPDLNLSNNTAVASFTVGQSGLPDPAVAAADLTLSPAGPVEAGTPVQLTSVIHNDGAPVANVPVMVTINPGTPQAVVVGSMVIDATMDTGAAVTLVTTLDSSQLSGSNVVQVQVNPGLTIHEYDTANDVAQATFSVQSGEARVSVFTDAPSYTADSPVTLTVLAAREVASGATYALAVSIETATGRPVAPVVSGWSEVLGGGVAQTLPFSWSTGSTAPGNYLAVATLTDPATGLVVARGQAPFVISSDLRLSLTVGPQLGAYQPGATAVIASTIVDRSANTGLVGLGLRLTVLTPGGLPFYSSSRQGISVPLGEELRELDAVVTGKSTAPGAYPISATLTDAQGNRLAAANGLLTIQPASVATGISGTIAATPGTFGVGQTVTLSATATDVGNVPYPGEPVAIEVGNPSTHTLVASFGSSESFVPGLPVTLSIPWGSAGIAPGDYLAGLVIGGTTVAHAVLHASSAPVDSVPPTIVVSGVSDGEITNQPVTPQITITDDTAFTQTVTLDGQPYASGTPVAAQGAHTLIASATDTGNNGTTVTIRFVIWETPPAIVVTGVTDGEVVNVPSLTPVVAITDPYLDPTKTVIALDGAPFASGTAVTVEADHVLSVSAADLAGNRASATVRFAIDRTPPAIVVSGVSANDCTAAAVTPLVSVTDLHLDPSKTELLLDGAAFVSGSQVAAQGQHTLTVFAEDLAQNTSRTSVSFTIDQTRPTVTVSGVTNGEVVNSPSLTPMVAVGDDAAIVQQTATLNGQPYTPGTPVSAEDDYVLVASATDCAGLSSSVTVDFAIDRTPPAIAVSGVTNGEVIDAPELVPVIQVSDRHLDPSKTRITLTTAGQGSGPFASGTAVTAENDYVLTVFAEDLAQNTSSETVHFAIDRTPPTITITGVSDGEVSEEPVAPVIVVTDKHLASVTTTLDGQSFTSGTTVSALGQHVLSVVALDQAQNRAQATVRFDLRAPRPNFDHGSCAATVALSNQALVSAPSAPGLPQLVATPGTFTGANQAAVQGAAVVGGDLALSNKARIAGTVYLGGTPSLTNQATVGAIVQESPPPSPCCPYDLATGMGNAGADNDDGQLAGTAVARLVSQGAFAESSGAVSFPSGRFYFTSFRVTNQGQVGIAKGARVEIFVNGPVTVSQQGVLTGDASDPERLLVVASGLVDLDNQAETSGLMYGGGGVTVENQASLSGAAEGASLILRNQGSLTVPPGLVPGSPQLGCQ